MKDCDLVIFLMLLMLMMEVMMVMMVMMVTMFMLVVMMCDVCETQAGPGGRERAAAVTSVVEREPGQSVQ